MAGDTRDGETCTDCGGVAPIEVGVWDVDEVAYHADRRCVSNSALKCFSDSVVRYYQRYVTGELRSEESDALRLGKAFHMLALEPEKAIYQIIRRPECDRRTKAGKEEWERFAAETAGKIIVSGDEIETLTGMIQGLHANYTTHELIEQAGMAEMAFRWRDESSGLWCKARTDLISEDVIVDLKTIDSLSNWEKNVANFGYYRQQAFYQSGDAHVSRHHGRDQPPKEFVFVVVEKQAPYESAAFTLSADAVAQGARENIDAMLELAERQRKSDWRSRYYRKITKTSLPRWAMKGA